MLKGTSHSHQATSRHHKTPKGETRVDAGIFSIAQIQAGSAACVNFPFLITSLGTGCEKPLWFSAPAFPMPGPGIKALLALLGH